MMTVRDIAAIMEAWAPRRIAWEKDNVGLLVGSPAQRVRRVMVALDVTDAVVAEAKSRSVDLLITHHPLMFRGIRKINDDDRDGRLVAALVRAGIALYAAHTNLDFTNDGVSHALARALGLHSLRVLHPETARYQKIAVFVPRSHAGAVMQAMSEAGAGRMGNYKDCSFRTEGYGTFTPLDGSRPFVGTPGDLETVGELRIEMILPAWKSAAVVSAMIAAHPYELPAYDLFPLANESSEYGAGVIGIVTKPVPFSEFLIRVHGALKTPSLRYVGEPRKKIGMVAVCGGSGSDLVPAAAAAGADLLVTADVRYHTFQDAEGVIALIDAGHFETEVPVVPAIVSVVGKECRSRGEKVSVFSSRRSANPVRYSVK